MFSRRALSGVLALAFWVSLAPAAWAQIDWEPDVYPHNNLFPSLIIGTARVNPEEELFGEWEGYHLGDVQGVVGAWISGLKKGDKIRLVVQENEFMRASRFQGTVERNPKGDVTVHPKISYRYDALGRVSQARPFDVTMELFVNDESVGEKTVTVTTRSVNDCLFGVEEDEENNSDYSWLFAAYVNENHPWVDRLLKEALDTGIVNSFDGYQSGDDEQVLKQIFAIWNVMQRRGMRYSDITTTAAESEGVYSQHVRLFDQALDAAQANCVDGSVLLGALLRKIGLQAYLVLVPGHMFLAVDLDENGESIIGIETTLMGEQSLAALDGGRIPAFDKLAPKVQQAAFQSFEGAVATGTGALEEAAERFDDESDLQHQLIDLAEARRMGILPISFDGSEATLATKP